MQHVYIWMIWNKLWQKFKNNQYNLPKYGYETVANNTYE